MIGTMELAQRKNIGESENHQPPYKNATDGWTQKAEARIRNQESDSAAAEQPGARNLKAPQAWD